MKSFVCWDPGRARFLGARGKSECMLIVELPRVPQIHFKNIPLRIVVRNILYGVLKATHREWLTQCLAVDVVRLQTHQVVGLLAPIVPVHELVVRFRVSATTLGDAFSHPPL